MQIIICIYAFFDNVTFSYIIYMFLILYYKYLVYTPFYAQAATKQLIMSTENTSLKNITPIGDSNTTNEMVIGKINTYQRTFLIVAGSLLALLVWIAVTGKSGGRPFKLSAHEITKSAGALADYQMDTSNLALAKDIFGVGAASENEESCGPGTGSPCKCCISCLFACCVPPLPGCGSF